MEDFGTCASKQAWAILLVSIMFVVAISKIPSQVVEEVTTLVMMMMVMMMYITIPSSHFPFRALSKMPSTLTNLVPSSSQKFYPQILPISVFFFFWQNFFAQLD
jgi:hypothetical protein